jgi:hypothetical protein
MFRSRGSRAATSGLGANSTSFVQAGGTYYTNKSVRSIAQKSGQGGREMELACLLSHAVTGLILAAHPPLLPADLTAQTPKLAAGG